jgi:amidase
MANFTEYSNYDGLGLADLIRRKEVSPTEVLEAALDAAARIDPQINAIVYDMTNEATRTIEQGLPDGPFTGVPFVIKDFVLNYAGVPTTSGSRLFEGFVPDHDSELMARFRRAGLVTFAKTTTSEVGFNANTEAVAYANPTHNPWDLSRSSSGSSGGSAASVATGIVPIAHANDGGGSIRMPASANGVFGLKPTRGRVPLGPDLGDDGLACLPVELVVSRSVRDTAAALDAVSGPDVGASFWAPPSARPYLEEVDTDPGKLRIAFTPALSDDVDVHPDAIAAVQDAAALCEELGHHVVEADIKIDRSAFARAWVGAMIAWMGPQLDGLASALGRTPGPDNLEWATWSVLQYAREQKSVELVGAHMLFNGLSRQFGAFFQAHDVLLTPTTSEPPFKSGRLNQNEEGVDAYEFIEKGTFSFGHTVAVFNATGQPAMSVPLYWNADDLPIGAHFVGRYADETTLIRLAGQLEKARPWRDKRPPIFA